MRGILGTPGQQGIWAQPGRPQQEKKGTSFLDRMLGLYGNDPNSHIPAEHRKEARGNALMGAGINVLANAGAGFQSQGFGEAIGNALQGAHAGAAQYGANLQQQNMQAKLRAIAESGTPEELQAMMQELIVQGGPENMKAAQMLAQIISARAGQNLRDRPLVTSPGQTVFNPATGREEYANPNERAAAAGAQPQLKSVWNPATGQQEYQQYDPNTGGFTPTGKIVKENSEGQPTELERRAFFMMPMAKEAMGAIDDFELGEGAPTRLQQLADFTNLNEAQSPGARQLYMAGRALGDTYLRITSGAAIKDEEIDMFVKTFLPYPGDDKTTRALKRTMRGHLITGLEVLGRRVASGAAPMFGDSKSALENTDAIVEIGRQEGEADLPPLELDW